MAGTPETVTIVFTDLVESTAIRSQLGEEAADALGRAHFTILSGVVAEHGGRVVKGLGDGILAVFTSAADAIDAAIAMQQQTHAYTQSEQAIGPLSTRIGISTGDITWDETDDIAGSTAVEAARLEAAAEGGQILCAELTRLIARGRGGHEFHSLGELELRGLPTPVPTCEVTWAPLPAPDASPAVPLPDELRETGRPFVGREAQLGRLDRALLDDRDTPLRLVWLAGEPGIGKTTLAAVAARNAHQIGRTVLFGRCDRELHVPYRPFTEALDAWARAVGEDAVRRTIGDDATLLARISRSIRAITGTPERADGADVERLELFEAVSNWLRRVEPIIVIDDVHWASDLSIQLLGHLARSPQPSGSRIICTTRPADQSDALRTLVSETVSQRSGELLELGGLDEEAIGQLAPAADPARLLARTGGNPLFLEALEYDSSSLGDSVEAAVGRRVAGLDESARDLLRLAAVSGFEFEPSVLARVLERDELAILDALERACDAGLVRELDLDRFAFSHGLVQEALDAEVTRTRRARLHHRIGTAIEQVEPGRIAELARHFDLAGTTDKAIEYLEATAQRCEAIAAYAEAAALHGRLAQLRTDESARLRHRAWAATFRDYAGDYSPANQRELAEVGRRALELGLHDIYGPAMLHAAAAAGGLGADSMTLEVADLDTIRGFPAPSQRVTAGTALAWKLALHDGRPDEAAATLTALAEDVDEARDPLAAGWFHSTRLQVMTGPDQLDERIAAGQTARQLLGTGGWRQTLVLNDMVLACCLAAAGRLQDAAELRDEMRASVEGRQLSFCKHMVETLSVMLSLAAGDFDGAHASVERARQLSERNGSWDTDGIYGSQKFAIFREQGRLGEIARPLQMLAEMDDTGAWRPGLAALYADQGMVEPARRELDRLLDGDGLPAENDNRRLVAVSFMADAAIACEAQDAAPTIETLLGPYCDLHIGPLGLSYYGPATRYLAGLARIRGDADAAERLYRRSLEQCRSAPSPVYEARTLVELAHLLSTTSRRAEANEFARAGLAIAERLGMASVAARASEVLVA